MESLSSLLLSVYKILQEFPLPFTGRGGPGLPVQALPAWGLRQAPLNLAIRL